MTSSASITAREAFFASRNDNSSYGYIAGSGTPVYESTDNNSGVKGIRRSFGFNKRASRPTGNPDHEICYGDRLFARLVMHGRTVMEFMMNSVNDLTELWGEVRRKCRGIKGLVRLYLRNASRGWSMVRPLMIYPEGQHIKASKECTPAPACATFTVISTNVLDADRIANAFRGEARQLSFTWDL